jgi:predicted component of type VI protein secretion system
LRHEPVVKTTVELSEELFRRAKAEAALRGRRFKDLVEEGLRLVLQTPRGEAARPSLEKLMEPARGIVDSGVPDLASNPKHLRGFGREPRRNR